MQVKINTGKLAVIIAGISLLVCCRKNDRFNYTDGTPGDGASVPSITVDTNLKNIDASKYAQARVFPGLVCSTEPRITVTKSMNFNYNFVSENLRISVPPLPQFSTGLYAAPGELVIIDVPAGEYALSAQIGAWTDNLSGISNPPRDPIIFSRTQLAPGRNYIRNLYGGHVYLFSGRPIVNPVNIKFTNVIKSPDFVLGETTNEEWKTAIQNSCVPWLEMRSENMVFVVPREYCLSRPFSDPTAAMRMWDDIIKLDYYKWEGLEENPADPIDKAPLLPWRCVLDIKPVVGYGHNGFPIVAQNDFSWFGGIGNVVNIDGGGSWGFLHELGHNNQQGRYWSWSTLGEVTCNLFSFKVANRLRAVSPTAWPPKHPALATAIPGAITWASLPLGTRNFDGTDAAINDPFARLTPFVQMFDKIPANWGYPGQPSGWELMTELYKKARRATNISLTDLNQHDFVYESICDLTKKNWLLFFRAWGISISNIAANKIAAKYPPMTQDIWKYNPLTRTGGDAQVDLKAFWTFAANSWATNEGSNGLIDKAFDGLTTTYWHSSYGTGTGPTSPNANTGNPAGFFITVDMIFPTEVKGFKFALRQSGSGVTTVVRNIKVEVSNDNSNWSLANFAIASPRGPGFVTTTDVQGFQSYNLTSSQTFRYFRISIPTNADNRNSGTSSAFSEIDIIKP